MSSVTDSRRPPTRGRVFFEAAIVGLLLLLLVPLAGCTNEGQALETETETAGPAAEAQADDGDSESDEKDDRLPVEVMPLERGPIEDTLNYSTNLTAEEEVEVFSQAARLVRELLVEEGDRVRRGQVMLRLQDDEQRSELARIESQLAKARREYQRQERLFTQDLISEQTMSEATYEVEQLEIALGDARRNLGYTEVRAPISGVVTGRHVNLGDTITVNQHLFDVVDFDSIVARVYPQEKELPRLERGQPARIRSASLGGDVRVGRVERIAPVVDPATGTVKVTIDVPSGQGLRPGLYVDVEVVVDTRDDALLVPKRAVIYDQNQAYVYRLTDAGTVERRRLVPALQDRDHVEPAPGSGLEEGDLIVVNGQAGLKDGARVRRIGEPEQPAEAGS